MGAEILKRLILVVIILVIYFFAVRPLRETVIFWQVNNLEIPIEVSQKVQFSYAPTSIEFNYYLDDGGSVEGRFKVPFGFFFLLATVVILIMNLSIRNIYALLILHAIGFLAVNICLYMGIYVYMPFLLGADLLSKYIIPLASFVTVAVGFIIKRNQNTIFLTPDSESNQSDT